MQSIRDQSNKSKKASKRRNTRKKSLSPTNFKTLENSEIRSADASDVTSKKYECKRSLSEGSGKAKHRKNNVRRTLSHPYSEKLQAECKPPKVQSDSESATCDNSLVPDVFSDNYVECINSDVKYDKKAANLKPEEIKPRIDAVVVEHSVSDKGRVFDKFTAIQATDEGISDESHLPLEITSSDRDTEDERKPKSRYSNPFRKEYEALNEEFRAGVKSINDQWKVLEKLRNNMHELGKSTQEQAIEPLIKFGRQQFAQDSGSDLESLAASTLRRVSVRRRRGTPETGSSSAKEDNYEAAEGGRMRPEDYRLVFISSDSSSRESEAGESSAGEDGSWDYFEAGGDAEAGGGAAAGGDCGRLCSCGAAPRVLPVPVPVPVPVPAALWPDAAAAWPFAPYSFQRFHAADMSRRLPNSGFLASTFTQNEAAATEVVPATPAAPSGDNGISKDQDSKDTFETVDSKKSNIVSMTAPSQNICQPPTNDRDKIIPETLIEPAIVMQKLSVHSESKESTTYALQPAAIPSNEPLVGYLYSDKAFCSTSDSGESTSEDEGVAHGSYDVAGAASASSDEERPPRYSDVFVVNPADSSSDVEDNADSSGLECSDGEPPLTAVEQLNNHINAEIADHSQYDPDDAYFEKLKEKEKLDEALPVELKNANDLIIPYGDPYIGIYDDSKQFKKCTDFKRFCDANMLHAEPKPVDADKIVFACSDITNFAVGFELESRRAEEKLIDRESPDPKEEKENEIAGYGAGGETKVKAEGVIANRFPDDFELAGEKESETSRNPTIGRTDDLSDASKFSFDDSGDSEGRESPPPTDRRPRTNADLLRGIERTISELLIKENSLAFGDGDRAEKLSPVTSDEEGERSARSAGCGQRPGSSDGATGTPVESPRSARADRCAPYTSRVMITQESSPSQVSVITSDTTRLMADVTVQHTNSQNENDKYRRFARGDEFEEREADSEGGHGGVRVVTNADTLSAVVCLEEGLADDDSWVEEADSTPSESDSGDDAAFEREEDFSAYRRQALDFTLHTIVEESCEESEPERAERKARPVSATELEKYFFFGLGDGRHASEAGEDVHSETSSACSEGGDSPAGDELAEPDERHDVERLASSRLEKYFLSGFMGFDRERRDSDGSGSVGSDSEGRHSPEQRKKRLVRARGTGRSHSSSLDNLLSGSEMQLEQQNDAASDSEGSSTETETYNDTSIDSQGDGSKRKKQSKKVRSSPGDERKHSTESRDEPSTRDDARSISEGEEDGSVTPQPEFLPLGSELSNSKKQTSRDSGFVGSCDDLLKNDVGADGHVSKPTDLKLDLEEIVEENKLDSDDKPDLIRLRQYPQTALMRKDSFNNWSSDEETNLMMNRMRQFFKTMVVAAQPPTEDPAPGSKPTTPSSNRTSLGPRQRRTAKPPQLVYFESELTRLMKTVPGIRDEEVKEIVEYLSSEDTWSDSYDSSDYTSSDVEGVGGGKAALQRQISESCKEIIDKFDRVEEASEVESPCAADHPNFGRDTAYVYQKLVASLNKISTEAEGREPSAGSPHGSPLVTKVIRHIGSRLVALMHEVSSGESGASASPRMRAPRRPRPASASTTEDDDSASDAGARAALPRSKSHDVLAHETQRGRGAEERDEREASDCDRFSWRGSFESALLAADSRGALATEAAGQRRSAGDLLAAQRSQSRSCGAIGGSEDRLWRGRRRSSAPDAAPEDEEERPRATGSLPRLPSGAAPVKSARYRPPGFTRAQRAVSAPGLHATRAPRRRPPPPAPIVSSPASAQSLQDEIYTAEILTATPRATLPRRSNSPAPHHEQEDDLDRLVGLHHNRSGLVGRSESMASVYSGAGDGARGSVTVRGAAQFSLLYNYRQGALEVAVRRCRDLAPVDVKRNRSDPYVKVYLLPDKSKCGKRKTKVKKNTLNPIFDETLRFVQPLSALSGRTLWLSVWHADMFGRNDFLGEVTLPLGDIVFDDPTPKWYNLQERTEQFEEHHGTKGDLIVGLKFELPDQNASPNNRTKGTLHVLVKEAKNLCASKPNGLADAFCKSYLLPERGRGAKQKTAVSRRTLSPRWETCFTYRALSLSDLQQRALELSVWDRDLLSSNDFMGGVRFSLGTGTYLGANVDWMDSMGKELTLWQTMMQRPNFWVEGSVPLRSSLSN